MTIQIDRTISVKDKEGHLVQVDGNENLITKSVISLSCDGPRCQQRHGKIVSTSFVEEELKDNPEAQPASLRKFGQWKFNLAVKEFCSLECAEDILKDADKTLRVTEALEVKPVLVQKTDGSPTAEDLDLAAKNNIPGVTATVADATGFSGV